MKRVEFGQRQGTINAAMCLSKNEPWLAQLDREYLHHVAPPSMKSKKCENGFVSRARHQNTESRTRTVYRDGQQLVVYDDQCFIDLFGGKPSAQNPER